MNIPESMCLLIYIYIYIYIYMQESNLSYTLECIDILQSYNVYVYILLNKYFLSNLTLTVFRI